VCAGAGGLLVQAHQAAEQFDVLPPGERVVQSGVLPGHHDRAANLGSAFGDVVSRYDGATGIRTDQSREHLDHGGLARAVRAENSQDAATRRREADPT